MLARLKFILMKFGGLNIDKVDEFFEASKNSSLTISRAKLRLARLTVFLCIIFY
jgi:hypothetical protein